MGINKIASACDCFVGLQIDSKHFCGSSVPRGNIAAHIGFTCVVLLQNVASALLSIRSMNGNQPKGEIMNEARYQELLEAEQRMRSCGCGGACLSCQREPKPISEEEMQEFIAEYESRA